jgi:hypothetical protein
MQWFKHDSNANSDDKLQNLLLDYGLEGYGLYWYCLELIVNKIDENNLTFELRHDARIIARNTGCTVQKVEEMMRKLIDLGLFENDGGRITCLKLRSRLDKSMTSNSYIRNLITNLKVKNEDYLGYVYFILAENETVKRIKIGRSKNPQARLNDLQRRRDCIGLKLTILHTIKSDDCVSLETEFHKKFKSLNIVDEWFKYDDEILSYIKSLRLDYDLIINDYDLKEEKRLEEIRTDKNTIDRIDAEFAEFWNAYPKKVGKDAALKSWLKLKPHIAHVMKALAWQTESDQWQEKDGKFIPNPATYLNQGRWKDEPKLEGVPF